MLTQVKCMITYPGHLKPSQMLSSPSRCEELNEKICRTIPNICNDVTPSRCEELNKKICRTIPNTCNDVTPSNSLCPPSKVNDLLNTSCKDTYEHSTLSLGKQL